MSPVIPFHKFRVVFRPSPFKTRHQEYFFDSEETIESILNAIPDATLPRHYYRVRVGDVALDHRFWAHCFPKAGVTVFIDAIMQGEDPDEKSFWELWGAIIIAPLYLPVWGFRELARALTPGLPDLSGAETEQSRNTNIKGSRNQARPYEVIPRPFGRFIQRPDYAALAYSESQGDDTYFRMLFSFGHGPLHFEYFRIGENLITNFSEVDSEVVHGFPADEAHALSLYTNQVIELPLSVVLSTAWATQTTELNTSEAILDINFPRGFTIFDNGPQYLIGHYWVEYRKVGDTDWTSFVDEKEVNRRETNPFTLGERIVFPEAGQYEVRVKRGREENLSAEYVDTMAWTAMRSVVYEAPFQTDTISEAAKNADGTFKRNFDGGMSRVAMRIRGSDQLNNIIDAFSSVVTSILNDYDSKICNFDGTDDYFVSYAGSGVGEQAGAAFSVEAWLNPRDQAGGAFQVGLRIDTGNLALSLRLKDPSTETWRIDFADDAGFDIVVAGSVGAWKHYAVTFDGVNTIALYVDGVLAGSTTATLSILHASAVYIGKTYDYAGASWSHFAGSIREVRIWDLELSDPDGFASAAIDNTPAYLLRNWRINEGTGRMAYEYARSKHAMFRRDEITLEYYMEPTTTAEVPNWEDGPAQFLRWEPRPTRNPASCFRAVLQNTGNKRPLEDSEIDLTELQLFHEQCRDPKPALRINSDIKTASGGHTFLDLTGVSDYTLQSGDKLEYTVMWTGTGNFVGVDLETATHALRNESATDQNGLNAHPATDISAYAYKSDYKRSISIPVSMIGQSVTKFLIAAHHDIGIQKAYIRDIRITDGKGTTRKSIWMSGDALPTYAVDSRSDTLNEAVLEAMDNRTVNRGYRFNHILDYSSTVFETLRKIAAAGHAEPVKKDNLWSVARDVPVDTHTDELSPAEIVSFSGEIVIRPEYHALRVGYFDEDSDYQQNFATVYRDGYSKDNATKFETLDVIGPTSHQEAHWFGRWQIAEEQLRPERFTIEDDLRHLQSNKGDVVRFAHDVPGIGLAFSRIKSIRRNASNEVTHLQLLHDVTMESGKTYCVRATVNGADALYATLATRPGDHSTVELATPVESDVDVDAHVLFGEAENESMLCRIKSIEHLEDFRAKIVLEPHAPGIRDAEDDTPIPAYDAMVTAPPLQNRSLAAPEIIEALSDETTARYTGSAMIPRIMLHVALPAGLQIAGSEYQIQMKRSGEENNNWQAHPNQMITTRRIYIEPIQHGVRYDIRLRAIDQDGRTSAWAYEYAVLGQLDPPPNQPVALWASEDIFGNQYIHFDLGPQNWDVIGAKLRFRFSTGNSWDEMFPLHTGVIPNVSPFLTHQIPFGTYEIGIVAVDRSGQESTALIVDHDFVAPQNGKYEYIWDARNLGWSGTKTACFINKTLNHANMGELEAASTSEWSDLPSAWSSITDNWNFTPDTFVYEHDEFDLGSQNDTIIRELHTVIGGTASVEARFKTSTGGAWSSWSTGNIGSQLSNAHVIQVRITVTPTGGAGSTARLIDFKMYVDLP